MVGLDFGGFMFFATFEVVCFLVFHLESESLGTFFILKDFWVGGEDGRPSFEDVETDSIV